MGLLKKIVAWVAKKLSKEQKAELFDKAVDKWAGKPKENEKEIIGPKTKFNTGRLDWREIEDKKQPKKKGK